MPTGGGKSLLFTAPACLDNTGVTIVVVAFRALINDLVDKAKKVGKIAKRTCHAWKVPHSLRSKTPDTSMSSGSCAQNHLVWGRTNGTERPTSGIW